MELNEWLNMWSKTMTDSYEKYVAHAQAAIEYSVSRYATSDCRPSEKAIRKYREGLERYYAREYAKIRTYSKGKR